MQLAFYSDKEIKMALMKKTELAQKLGVSKAYISKLIKQGRLIDILFLQ